MGNISVDGQVVNANSRTRILDVNFGGGILLNHFSLSSKSASGDWEIFFNKLINRLTVPVQPALTSATTGGSIPRNSNVYVRITTVDGSGLEGTPSLGNLSITTGGTTDTNKVTASWTAIAGASSYNIYVAGSSGSESFLENTASTSYVITTVPVYDNSGIPTNADLVVFSQKNVTEEFSISGIAITSIVAYITTPAATEASINFIFNL